jgi:hypothetical protein
MGGRMKDLFEVLRQKEREVQQLQEEINTLKMAARLLADEGGHRSEPASSIVGVAAPQEPAISHAPNKPARLRISAQLAGDQVPAQFP